MVTVRDGLSVVDCDREYSLRCIGVWGNVGGSLQFLVNWADRFYSIKMCGLVFCELVSVCCGFRKYLLRCYGVWCKCLHGLLRLVIALTDGFCCDICLLVSHFIICAMLCSAKLSQCNYGPLISGNLLRFILLLQNNRVRLRNMKCYP